MASASSLLELARGSAAGDGCSHCFWVSRVITDGSWLFLHFKCFTWNTFFPLAFWSAFSSKDLLLLLSSPTSPDAGWSIRRLMMWKCCLSPWSVFSGYLLMSPAYLHTPLHWRWDGRAYSRDAYDRTCICHTTQHFCVLSCGSNSCVPFTQINSAVQLPLGCTSTPGHRTCPNQKVTGKIWWVIQRAWLACLGKNEYILKSYFNFLVLWVCQQGITTVVFYSKDRYRNLDSQDVTVMWNWWYMLEVHNRAGQCAGPGFTCPRVLNFRHWESGGT